MCMRRFTFALVIAVILCGGCNLPTEVTSKSRSATDEIPAPLAASTEVPVTAESDGFARCPAQMKCLLLVSPGPTSHMYVIDGVVLSQTFSITQADIAAIGAVRVDFIAGDSAVKLYGSAARNGVTSLVTSAG